MKSLKNPESNKKDRMKPSSSPFGTLTSSDYIKGDDMLNHIDDKNNSSIDLNLDNIYDDKNGQRLLFDHNEQLKSFINEQNLKFSKSSSLSSREQSNYLYSLINNITGDLISMKNPNLFKTDTSNGDRSIDQIFKNLSFALFIAYNTLQESNQKVQNKLHDLQKRYDESLSPQKTSSGSNHSDLNFDKEYCENNESLLKSMTSKFDELTDEMHKLSLKNADQESSIERLKQQKMDLELQIDHLEKQLKSSRESSQKSIVFNSNDFISASPPSSNEDSVTSNARIFVLENDVSALSIRVNELNASNEKKRDKIKMLIKIVKDKDSKLQDAQRNIESLQIKYDKLSLENDEKEDRIKSIYEEFNSKIDAQSSKNGEIDNLNQALNVLSAQMQEMNQEIQFECKAKNDLFNITQEQQQLLVKQEQYINILTEKIESLEEKNNDFEIQIRSVNDLDTENKNENKFEDNPVSFRKLEDEIMSILTENFDSNNNYYINDDDQFLNQIKEELKKSNGRNKNENSILSITKLLIDKINSLNSNKNELNLYNSTGNGNASREQVQRLLNYISNLLRFIDQIANSGEVQDWIISTNQQDKESFRQDLIKQCTRIDSFLKQNYYYEYLESSYYNNNEENEEETENENIDIDDADFLNISKKAVQQICNENQPLDELAVVFKMFASSNDFLRRFSEELKLQNDSLISDLHGIRNELIDRKNKEEQSMNESNSSLSQEPRIRDANIDNSNLNVNPSLLVKLYNYLRAIHHSLSSLSKQKVTPTSKSHKNVKNKKNVSVKNKNDKDDNNNEYDYSDDGYDYDYTEELSNYDDLIQIQEMVKNCLDIINDSSQNQNQSPNSKSKNKNKAQQPYIDGYMIKYVSKLEKKVHKLEEINGNLYQRIKALKSAKNKQKKEFEEQVEGSKKCNEDLSSTIVDKDKSLSELEILVDHKNEEINSLKRKIIENEKKFNENIESLKQEMQNNQNESQGRLENLKNSSNNDIMKIKQDYDEKIQNLNQRINDNKIQFKSEIKKIQAEYEAEIQRSVELREHFESLTCDLKNKLQDSRDREKNEKDEKLKASRDIADLKTELSKLRIENKMMSMKLQTSEEKFVRERDLRATQNRMSILKLESDKEKEIKDIMESSSMKFHSFLKDIFEIFSDFVTPRNNGNDNQCQQKISPRSISKENAFSLMNKVNEIAKQADRLSKENTEYKFQFNEIKEMLMVNDSNDEDSNSNTNEVAKLRASFIKTIQALKDIVNNRNNSNSNSKNGNKKKPNDNSIFTKRSPPVTARDWEVWARRLHALATDSFCTMKPAKDLQQVIEEELVSAVGQRPLFRKVEILRCEKFILQRGLGYVTRNELTEKNLKTINNLVPVPSSSALDGDKKAVNPSSLSIIQILAVVVSIRRMQKLSGHLKLFFGIGSKKQNQKASNVTSFVNNRNTNRNIDNSKIDCDDDLESNNNNNESAESPNDVLTFRARKSSDKKRYPILNYVE